MTQEPLTRDRIQELITGIHPELKALAEAKLEATFLEFEQKLDRKLSRPEVTFDLKGRTAGYAFHNPLRVQLNAGLYKANKEDFLERTVPHEVAHIVQFEVYPHSKPHGYEWQNLMYLIGLEPTRCHQYETTPARKHVKWSVTCTTCGRVYKVGSAVLRRLTSGQRKYYCTVCNTQLQSPFK